MGPRRTTVGSALTRRSVLQSTTFLAAGAAGAVLEGCVKGSGDALQAARPLRIGLVTDIHYADKESRGTRHYRASLRKLTEAVGHFNETKADFVVELGDLIDAAESVEQELGWLDRIESVYAQLCCPRYRVLGNHCVQTLTKARFLTRCGMDRSFHAFDTGGFHFVVLDACFRRDGISYDAGNFDWKDANVPPEEIAWLRADLEAATRPAIVFVHQRLDVDDAHGVGNRAEVRELLERSGRVLAVFQGHNHVNDLRTIDGISYFSLAAMVEEDTNAYALLKLHPNGAMRIDGYGRQRTWGIDAA